MRAVFSAACGFWVLLCVLFLLMAARAVPDSAQVARWAAAGMAAAFIAIFWAVVRRRYVANDGVTNDPVVLGLGLAGIAFLVVVMVVFRMTQ